MDVVGIYLASSKLSSANMASTSSVNEHARVDDTIVENPKVSTMVLP